jgi:hypothetical protein
MNTKGRKTDMYKKILRILSLTLALLLVISVAVPAPATAAATTADEIKQQIKTTYKRAKSYYGRNSFDGYCGAFVTAELYLMGITATPVGFDGKDAYNAFHRQSVTSGGYGVKAYPAKAYSLRSALNEITKNGTQNAYNILWNANDRTITNREHIRNISRTLDDVANGICPRCGNELVLRTGKNGSFYGCLDYPRCKFTKQV